MANVLSVVWSVVGSVATLTGLLVWAALMMPGPVGRARLWLEVKPAVSFFLGVLFCGATLPILIGFALVRKSWMPGILDAITFTSSSLDLGISGYYTNTLFRIVHLLLAAPIAVGAVIGGAGFALALAGRIGERTRGDSPMLALVGGALCTSLSAFFPLIGWLIFFPIVGLMSVGAGIMGIVTKRACVGRPRGAGPAVSPDQDLVTELNPHAGRSGRVS
jgi:hypothetical protein